MTHIPIRVVFFGTPDFAVSSLEALLRADVEVTAVVTTPDKPAGRGRKVQQSAVYEYAKTNHLPILQPDKLRNKKFLDSLRALQADLFVVVAFRMLPEVVWNMPPMGTINVHASLLPNYRGAAPINHALINGEDKTGVTTFLLQHEIDTGHILLQQEVTITDKMNAGELHDLLASSGAKLLVDTINGLINNSITPQPQKEREAVKHAPKLNRDFLEINPNQEAVKVYNHIRGLAPYPSAFIYLDDKILKIKDAQIGESIRNGILPGSWDSDGKSYLRLATTDNWINIIALQPEGKKQMDVASFLRGYRGSLVSK